NAQSELFLSRCPREPTLFPYTTLFRSVEQGEQGEDREEDEEGRDEQVGGDAEVQAGPEDLPAFLLRPGVVPGRGEGGFLRAPGRGAAASEKSHVKRSSS